MLKRQLLASEHSSSHFKNIEKHLRKQITLFMNLLQSKFMCGFN